MGSDGSCRVELPTVGCTHGYNLPSPPWPTGSDHPVTGAVFEELADGSTALVLRAGSRLKLDLKALLNGEWKNRGEGKVRFTGPAQNSHVGPEF